MASMVDMVNMVGMVPLRRSLGIRGYVIVLLFRSSLVPSPFPPPVLIALQHAKMEGEGESGMQAGTAWERG